MTIARLAATYGEIREDMGTYGKSRPRLAGHALTYDDQMVRYGKIRELMGSYGKIWELA